MTNQIRMTNDQMTKQMLTHCHSERSEESFAQDSRLSQRSFAGAQDDIGALFVIRSFVYSSLIRHSNFVIRHLGLASLRIHA
jgi:hypothetical protein